MHIGLCLTLSAIVLSGQAIDERLAPKTPPKAKGESKLPEPAAAPPATEEDTPVADKLNGLIVVKTKEEIRRDGVDNVTGLDVHDIPLLAGPSFAALVQPYFGQPVSIRTLREMQRKIILYCRENDRPLVDVIVPNQEVKGGVLQLVLIEGRIGNLSVRNEDPQWFKDAVITKSLRATSGDVIREKRLLSDVNWLNRNPFREVSLAFKQGDKPGLSDLQLQVEDRFPLRGFVGYEDTGSKITGEDRLIAGFNWGNAFGLDHQLNYQFTTDPSFDLLLAHSASYVAPLPWRHTLTMFASYVDITADETDPNQQQTGLNYQLSARYAIPLPLVKNYQHEISLGFDYKHNENELLFGKFTADATETDVGQFAASYSGLLSDRWGRTSVGLQGYFSPGGLYGENTDEAFSQSHSGASSDYVYGRLTLERITRLPWDFSLVLRGTGQAASGNLIASEQLGMGGFSSVRGYDEREVNGDRGGYGNLELRTPSFSLLRAFGKSKIIQNAKLVDQLQFLAFMDYGFVENNEPDEGETTAHLWSVGGGLRYTINRYLNVRFDYGVQLRDSGDTASDYGSRGHLGVVLSF
jgi:hemolysin activation/secretion protein